MNTVVKIEPKDIDAIPYQEASLDIWDKKYRLSAKDGTPVDKTMDDTYKRVARALADVEHESVREQWYERFVWALRRGAIPAGRVTSNAGALEHKPATSTINCTVSGTIEDSMDGILDKVHEAGLTLKAGCGIGYEFSTLRPRGAYVSGAGAYTSGPMSFMDIYDKMCFTVSSAGGRRGAQMGTYDYAEPGFILIDRVNEMNNNWWCENIRATNPCGEQPLPPYGSCLLGSVNLTTFVRDPFGPKARFDWEEYKEVVRVFTRMLDNVVEINGLPLPQQRNEILSKRRHGMGFLGLGSTLTMLKMRYGSPESCEFTEAVSRDMALAGWEVALSLAQEKGPAPIMSQEFDVTAQMLRQRPEMIADGYKVGDKVAGR